MAEGTRWQLLGGGGEAAAPVDGIEYGERLQGQRHVQNFELSSQNYPLSSSRPQPYYSASTAPVRSAWIIRRLE
jgi:hypothetical protein